MLQLHQYTTKNSNMEILGTVQIKDNKITSTNLEQSLITTSINNEDGIYIIVGNELFKTDFNMGDFPCLEDKKTVLTIQGDQKLFNQLKVLKNYCSTKEMYPAMAGVLFDLENLNLVATNGHIMKVDKIEIAKTNHQFIIPANSIKMLSQILSEAKLKEYSFILKITTSGSYHYASFEFPDWTFKTRLIDEKFPMYKSIIPECNQEFQFKGLLKQVSYLKQFTNKVNPIVNFNINSKKITVENIDLNIYKELNLNFTSTNGEIKKLNSFAILMPVRQLEPNETDFAVDINYLESILKTIKSDTVYWTFTRPSAAFILSETSSISKL